MAESTLSLSIDDLRSDMGDYLGYGRTYASMSAKQTARVDALLKTGLRKFYIPALKGIPPHEWSFLKPITTLALIADDYDYDLPDDFLAFDPGKKPTFATTDNAEYPLELVDESRIRALRMSQTITISGPPRYMAERPKAGTPMGLTAGQRFEVIFFPTPDAAYTVTYRYKVAPNAISDSQKYPYGGMQHAETIRAACLCACEQFLNDGRTNWTAGFDELLMASIQADQQKAPASLGYNGDKSNCRRDSFSRVNLVTVNGVVP